MSTAPAFQLYAADFYMDTVGWTPTEVGVYFRLLMHEWINGPLPTSMVRLSRIAGCDARNMQKMWLAEIANKFSVDDAGMYVNARLERTRREQEEYRKKQEESGRLGGLKSQKKRRVGLSEPSSTASSTASSENKALQSSSSTSLDKSNTTDIRGEDQKPAPLEKQETPKPKTVIPQAMENGNGGMEKFTKELQNTLSEVYQRYPDFNIHRQVQLFLELNLKSGPRKVIIHSLNAILKAKDGIITARTVGKYLSTTFTCEHAKYNARDHEREAEVWKKPLTPAAKAIMEQLGLGGFGGGNG